MDMAELKDRDRINKLKTSPTKAGNKSPAKRSTAKCSRMGIKPFLCLKGKLDRDISSPKNSPKKSLTVKDRIKKFESNFENSKQDKTVTKEVNFVLKKDKRTNDEAKIKINSDKINMSYNELLGSL